LRQYHIDENGLQIRDMLPDQEGLLGGRPTNRVQDRHTQDIKNV